MRILIVEDEARIAKRIERMLRNILQERILSLRVISDLQSALYHMDEYLIDLLFLDLNLQGKDGFEILKQVNAEAFHTIIISAHKDKAIEAFEYGVLDFIPKPFHQERIEQALERLDSQSISNNSLKYLSIKTTGRIELFEIQNIHFIKGAGIYSEVHFEDGKQALHDKSLEKLSQLLPSNFVRIHKSYIVNLQEAQEIIVESGSKYQLILKDQTTLPIGRTWYKSVKEILL